MFGYHLQKKSQTRKEAQNFKKEKEAFGREKEVYNAERPGAEMQDQVNRQNQISQRVKELENQRNEGRQKGRIYSKDVLNQEMEGLSPKRKNAIQHEANQGIQRDYHNAQRQLVGQQGQRGIGPKSGVAFAQGQELQRARRESEGQVQRDISKLDYDASLKKLAASFGIELGEGTQAQLDNQLAQDELELAEEKRRQKAIYDQYNRQFSRL